MKHTLEIDSVEVSFAERQILQGAYLKMETGCVTALLGSNGSGKSCLMRVLCNTLCPGFKSMRIDGVWTAQFDCHDVRYVPQHKFLPSSIRVRDVFRDFDLDAQQFVDWFPDLRYVLGSRIETLSGGERRVVECYAILCSDTRFVMLDEPFSQVMPLHIDVLKRLIVREKERKGILLTDHLYAHVQSIADTLYLLESGHTRLVHSTEDLVRYGYISPSKIR
ncbi:MAG: ATP-binding cassette domain-containing protein [Alistipes sp.]